MGGIGTFFSLLWVQANVGIGTASPSARLHVVNHSSLAEVLRVANSSGSVSLVVTESGRVGIATATPVEALHIQGNFQLEGDFRPGGNPGLPGQVLMSQGAATPTWQHLPTGAWRCHVVETWSSGGGTNGWSGAGVTSCSPDVALLGGHNQCGNGCNLSKTFTGLPPHTQVMVEVAWWAIDSLNQRQNNHDRVRLRLDNTAVAVGIPTTVSTSVSPLLVVSNTSHCGVTELIDRGPFWLTARMPHSSSSLKIDVENLSNVPANRGSIGLAMVRIWLR
ncbi:MAG: hypothetical protein RMK98_06135 [Bacteroidia bacterium]|nr:hypothetical protein [Bacteroidia bacterium]